MNADKLAYFAALGVLAFGLASEYQKGNFAAIHHAVGTAENTLCRLVTRAEQTLALAGISGKRQVEVSGVDGELLARQQSEIERAMAERQAEIDRAVTEQQAVMEQAMAERQAAMDDVRQQLDQMHMALDRARGERLRALERVQQRLSSPRSGDIVVVCPKTGARIVVHSGANFSGVHADLSNLEVGNWF